jgi:hypothetical protein
MVAKHRRHAALAVVPKSAALGGSNDFPVFWCANSACLARIQKDDLS